MDISRIFATSFCDEEGNFKNTFSQEDLQRIYDHKLFKCFLPTHLGGLGMDLHETLDVIRQCAYLSGSLGWLIQIGNGGNYFVTNLEQSAADDLFSAPDAVIAGSGTPTGTAVKTTGGYSFTGKWRFCSGSDYATLFTATCKVEGSEEIISGVIPREEVTVLPDWDTLGMRLTSTNSISLDQVFVPHKHIFKTLERKSYFDLPILDLPFVIYAQVFFIHVVYGMVARLLDEAEKLFEKKRVFWSMNKPVKYTKVRLALENGRSLLQQFERETDALTRELEEHQLENLIFQEDIKVTIINQNNVLRQYCHETFNLFGMDVLYRQHPVCVFYTDILTIAQHSLLN